MGELSFSGAFAALSTLWGIALAFGVVFCILAVFYDLRQRRIPNNLNFLAVLLASFLAALAGAFDFNFVLFVVACFIFGYLLYRLGVWAGGDAKFFTALMAFLPIFKGEQFELIVAVFLASAALTIPVLVFIHWKKLFSLRADFISAALLCLRPALVGAVTSSVLYFLFSFFTNYPLPQFVGSFAISFVLVFVLSWLPKCFGVVSQKILRRSVAVSSLKEGDIPAQSVYLKEGMPATWVPPSPGKILRSAVKLNTESFSNSLPPSGEIVSCLRARGISLGEISKLKEAGVTSLVVKESIPLAPALVLGFWLVAWLV